jgi:CRISPR-associated protein Cas2
MLVITYDISDDKLRTGFSKFLEKYGRRMQYSVFEIKNSTRILNLILKEINGVYLKKFSQSDSIIIFQLSSMCKVNRYGYAKNEESDFIII